MSQISCKYHPKEPAKWACPSCNINYCRSCIPDNKTGRGAYCPVCKNKLQSFNAGNTIKPFWIISGRFFLYPLHLYPLSFILVLSFLNSQFDPTLMGSLMRFVISVVFMKYTYAVLEDTAHGHLKPLPINAKVINNELDLPFKQIFLTFLISTINFFVLKTFGATAFSISAILSAIIFPANVMVLAMEHSFFAAFNPFLIFGVIKRIGAAYILLIFLLLMLLTGSSKLMSMLYGSVPYSIYISLSSFINMYFALIMFNLLGYTLYQYHDKLGYDVEIDNDNPKENDTIINPEMRTIEILIQEGKEKEASDRLLSLIRHNPSDNALQIQNLKLQNHLGNKDAFNKYAKNYITYLFSSQQEPQIAKIIPFIFSVMPSFKPDLAIERLALANILKNSGHSKFAVNVLTNLHIDFPQSSIIPEAYLMASKILCEKLGNDSLAKKLLAFIIQKYPNNPLDEEIKAYLAMVKSIK